MDELYVVAVKLEDERGSRMWVCELFTEMEQAQACCNYFNALYLDDDTTGYFWYHVELCETDYVSLLKRS